MEKKEPRGKSSILKPQKARKPFEDLDLGNAVPDDLKNMDKSERRVSFASSNFVKPFTADPEKNTIWDSTYEEAIESLESPQAEEAVCKLDLTLPVATCSEFKNENIYCDEMSFTTPISVFNLPHAEDVKNSNQMGFDSTEMEFTTIDIETVENSSCVDMEFTAVCETVKESNFKELNTTVMKSTTLIEANIIENNNGASMELATTHINVVENNCMGTISADLELSEINGADMELTSPVSIILRHEDKSELNNLEISLGLSCDDTEKLINYNLYELDKRNDHVEKLVEDIAPKVCKELEEGVAAREKQMQEFSRMSNLLKEFFNKRAKQETTPLAKTQVNLDKCSNNEPGKLTWKDRILKSYKGNEEYWSIKSLDGSLYEFSTLYGTIEFSVQLNEENGYVLDIQLRSRADYGISTLDNDQLRTHLYWKPKTSTPKRREKSPAKKTPPIALYTHKVFMEKLKLKHIQSALGSKFEILSLLDYVHLTMEKIVKMDEEFALLEIMYGVTMDRDFKITFALISVKYMFSWIFTIDVADYDHIDGDKVSYYARIGDLREREIKKCINASPKGFAFVKAFVEGLNTFLENIEKT
ncbi:hypothetical protein Trydic_g1854 [Trypoxylus dichotomus]